MTGIKHKILFVCVHNSARSQMAEAFLTKYGEGRYIAESAGLEPGTLNPDVVKVMQETGIDLSKKGTQSVFDVFRKGDLYEAVITVCDGAERCPIFPGKVKRIAWSFKDPSSFIGTHGEILQQTREVRDEIERAVIHFVHVADKITYWA